MLRTDLIADIIAPLPKGAKPARADNAASAESSGGAKFAVHLPQDRVSRAEPKQDYDTPRETADASRLAEGPAAKTDNETATDAAPVLVSDARSISPSAPNLQILSAALLLTNPPVTEEAAASAQTLPVASAPPVSISDGTAALPDALQTVLENALTPQDKSKDAAPVPVSAASAAVSSPDQAQTNLQTAVVAPAIVVMAQALAPVSQADTESSATMTEAVESVQAASIKSQDAAATAVGKSDKKVAAAQSENSAAPVSSEQTDGRKPEHASGKTPTPTEQTADTIKTRISADKAGVPAAKAETVQQSAVQIQKAEAPAAPALPQHHSQPVLHNDTAQIAAPQSAHLQTQLRMPMALERVPFEITSAAHRGEKEFSIRLDPPELGRVDVSVSVDKGGRVATHLVVERAETLDQLRRDAPNLERAFQNSGLKTDSSSLQFSLRDQGAQNFAQDQSGSTVSRRGVLEVDLAQLNGWAKPQAASLGNWRGAGVDMRI